MGSHATARPAPLQPVGVVKPPLAIPALERGIAILRLLFDVPTGLDVREIAQRTDIPRASLYRMLQVLTAHGLIAPSQSASRFVLGPGIARLASRVPQTDDLAVRAQPVMQALVLRVNETVKVVVRQEAETVTVAVIHPRTDSRLTAYVGSRLPLYLGASQHLLLSRAPDAVRESVLAGAAAAGVDVTVLARRLAVVARREWEISRGEGNKDGVGGVSALIHEAGRPPRAAITVVFVARSKTSSEIESIRHAVTDAARTVSTG